MRGGRLLLVAALLVGACDGGRGGSTDTTLPPRVSTTASTVPDYTVPAVIDVAYVEKVMAALDHVYGDAIRILARERRITQDFLEHLAAIYAPEEFEFAQRIWVHDVASGLQGLRADPGDPRTEIQRLVTTRSDCVLFAARRDFSRTRTTPDKPTPQWFVALKLRSVATTDHNPTPFVIAFDGFKPDGTEPSPC